MLHDIFMGLMAFKWHIIVVTIMCVVVARAVGKDNPQ